MGASKKPEVKHYFHISMMEHYPRRKRERERERERERFSLESASPGARMNNLLPFNH